MIKASALYISLSLLLPLAGKTQPVRPVKIDKKQPRAAITMHDFRYTAANNGQNSFFKPFQNKPGLALLSSLVIPGSGQAVNKKWVRAGLYFLAETAFLTVHIRSLYLAHKKERQYKSFANGQWSVITYAQWLVSYHDQNNLPEGSEYVNRLRSRLQAVSPSYSPADWNKVDIELLRNVERNTPFVYPDGSSGATFSHVMPDYGSQQYYELISKYYQFGPGWVDFGQDRNGKPLDNPYQLLWDGTDMPFNFFKGAALAKKFNDKYTVAGNMLSLLILNHVVSALDAFITVKLKNSRLDIDTTIMNPHQMFLLKYRF